MKTYLAAVLAMIAGAASAQNLNKFVISDEAAKKTLIKNEISADAAAKITQACVDFAIKNNMAVSVFILSPTGQIVHAHRMDGQVPINTETALLKAQSVLYTRDSTHARANQVANNVSLQLRWDKLPVFPVSGGLPIVVDGQMIGAIGVGGGNRDEDCAYTALTTVIGPQPPLAGGPSAPPLATQTK
ncbi:MAG: glcG [Bryobacterales bacterium]|jgi:glc operon protein GlcG|nr:glcG [Bryobacterales bacterium]